MTLLCIIIKTHTSKLKLRDILRFCGDCRAVHNNGDGGLLSLLPKSPCISNTLNTPLQGAHNLWDDPGPVPLFQLSVGLDQHQ